ncbi:hypothetical protein D3C72_1644480 [compost metagenome]
MKSFAMKKGLVGVGINWIRGKNGNIKFWRGENPFGHLSVRVSRDGRLIDLLEYKDGSWVIYRDLPQIANLHFKERDFGKRIKLSDLFHCYSYRWDNGNENFAKWIENAAISVER